MIQGHVDAFLGKKFPGPVPVDLVDADFVAKFAADLEEKMIPPGLVEASRRLSVRMRLVPAGYDVSAAQIELVKKIVVGLYDPIEDRFYLVKDRAAPTAFMFDDTVAHELVHAYRDIDKRYFERTLTEVLTNADRAIALSCLTEGDATLLGQALGLTIDTEVTPKQLKARATELLKVIVGRADVVAAAMGDEAQVPPEIKEFPYALREMFMGRYSAGFVFAAKLYGHGGLEALANAFDHPPRSTEQVLHPEKYVGPVVDEPTIFSGGSPVAALGDGWSSSGSNTMGEFEMRVHFHEKLGRAAARKAAEGWDGARYHFCEKEGTSGFVGLITTWDTEQDAKEFAKAWADWAGKRDGEKPAYEPTGKRLAVETKDGLVVIDTAGKDVLVADGVPADRIEAVLAALASATRK